jgi:hypothetical protein
MYIDTGGVSIYYRTYKIRYTDRSKDPIDFNTSFEHRNVNLQLELDGD